MYNISIDLFDVPLYNNVLGSIYWLHVLCLRPYCQ